MVDYKYSQFLSRGKSYLVHYWKKKWRSVVRLKIKRKFMRLIVKNEDCVRILTIASSFRDCIYVHRNQFP